MRQSLDPERIRGALNKLIEQRLQQGGAR